MPAHNHILARPIAATWEHATRQSLRRGKVLAQSAGTGGTPPAPFGANIYSHPLPTRRMNAGCVANNGSSQPHENMSPYLVLNFVIALVGIFPSQN